MKLAVIGIGQRLRGDDAAGLEVVQRWQELHPKTAGKPEIIAQRAELPGLALLDLIGNVDAAILVDAVRSSAPAGTIHRLDPDQLSAFAGGAQSAHGWGVAETLALAERLDLPARGIKLRIVGIEAGRLELGSTLSPEVEQAIPAACEALHSEVLSLLN